MRFVVVGWRREPLTKVSFSFRPQVWEKRCSLPLNSRQNSNRPMEKGGKFREQTEKEVDRRYCEMSPHSVKRLKWFLSSNPPIPKGLLADHETSDIRSKARPHASCVLHGHDPSSQTR